MHRSSARPAARPRRSARRPHGRLGAGRHRGHVVVQRRAGGRAGPARRELHRARSSGRPRSRSARTRPASRCGSASAPSPTASTSAGTSGTRTATAAGSRRAATPPTGCCCDRTARASCASASPRPRSPATQPTIAPDGISANDPAGCNDSDLVSPLPAAAKPKIDQIATLPKQGKRKCLSRRSFKIRLREPSGDALKTASVFLNGKRIEVRKRQAPDRADQPQGPAQGPLHGQDRRQDRARQDDPGQAQVPHLREEAPRRQQEPGLVGRSRRGARGRGARGRRPRRATRRRRSRRRRRRRCRRPRPRAGRGGPRWRCCPSRAARTGSRRGRRPTRRATSAPCSSPAAAFA